MRSFGSVLIAAVCVTGCARHSIVVGGPSGSGVDAPTAPGATPVLAASTLSGPYPTRDEACSAASKGVVRAGIFRTATCTPIAVETGREAWPPAALLVVKDGAPASPRLAEGGAYFLAVSAGGAWFTTEPLDQTNSDAGHTFVPAVSAPRISTVERPRSAPRVLYVFSASTQSVCTTCTGTASDQEAPRTSHGIALVCGRVGSGKPECTPALSVKTGAEVTINSDDTLTVDEPGARPARYKLTF